MGQLGLISSIRLQNYIDVYLVNSKNQLIHYYVNNQTNWLILSQVIYEGAQGKIAVIRYLDYIDIYFVNTKSQLVHMYANFQFTKWQYWSQVLLSGIDHFISPVALRYQDYIDVYCVDQKQDLIHLWSNIQTNWSYNSQVIRNCSSKIQCLSGVRTKPESLDIYFIQGEKLFNSRAGNYNNWTYQFRQITDQTTNVNSLQTIRNQYDLDIFYCDNQRYIRQLCTGQRTNWEYRSGQRLGDYCKALDGKFCSIRFQDHIDLYFIGFDSHVYHTYSGCLSDWKWTNPEKISQIPAISSYGITACRKQNAIDVFYMTENQQIQNLFIGQGTNNDWSRYWSKQKQFTSNTLLNKLILNWESISHQCHQIGQQGYHGKAYFYPRLNLVLKILKNPNMQAIMKQVDLLDKLQPIWPNLCQYQVKHNGRLVGFSVKRFEGKKWGQIVSDPKNIFQTNIRARIEFFVKVKNLIAEVQKLNICHGDLSFGNVLIHIKSKQKCQFDISVIDFGNGFSFSEDSQVQQVLTGWQFLKPPQSRVKQPYDPKGVNAYQVGRMALHVLLMRKFKSYNEFQIDPNDELQRLINSKLYSKELINLVQNLVNPWNIKLRNKSLIENHPNIYQIGSNEPVNIRFRNSAQQDSNIDEYLVWFTESAILFLQATHPILGAALGSAFALMKILFSEDSFEKIKTKIQKIVDRKISQFAEKKAKQVLKTITTIVQQAFNQLKDDNIPSYDRRCKFDNLQLNIYSKMSDLKIEDQQYVLLPTFIMVCTLHIKLLNFGLDFSHKFKWTQQQKKRMIQKLKTRTFEYAAHYHRTMIKCSIKYDKQLQPLYNQKYRIRSYDNMSENQFKRNFPKISSDIENLQNESRQYQQKYKKFQKLVNFWCQKVDIKINKIDIQSEFNSQLIRLGQM